MTHQLYPCLWFDQQAREAADLYTKAFPGAEIHADTGLVVITDIYGHKIMGLNGGPAFQINPSISLYVRSTDKAQAGRTWDHLAEGGKVMMPLGQYPWSECYGWVQDRFGMTWQITVVNQPGDPPAVTPSLLFTGPRFGQALNAIERYRTVFPGTEVRMQVFYPETEEHAGKLMFAELGILGKTLILMDGPGEHAFQFNEAVSLVVDCENQEEVDRYWEGLINEGGRESQCGWLKDPFGISWQIVPVQLGALIGHRDREKAGRALQAMLGMKKLVIDELEKAFDGR